MSDIMILTAVEQQDVLFYEDELIAVRAEDGNVYVSLRHLSDALGVTRQSQVRRVKRDAVLTKGYRKGASLTPNQRGSKQMNWLRVDLIPYFMTGLQIKNIKEEIRPKIERFQNEAAKILWEAFQEGRLSLTSDEQAFQELLRRNANSPEVQAYHLSQALAKMARQQVILAGRVEQNVQRLDVHESRLDLLEAQMGDSRRFVTSAQATHISQAVKAIALELGKRTGRNEFPGVWGELYRQYEVPSYRELPAARYDEAMDFLRQWYESLIDNDAPF